MKQCKWGCGRKTRNRSGIDDFCWKDRENIYLAGKAKEAARQPDGKKIAAGKRSAAKKAEIQAESRQEG